jgi:hypothetical protein
LSAEARDFDFGDGFALFAMGLCFFVFPRGSDFAVRMVRLLVGYAAGFVVSRIV